MNNTRYRLDKCSLHIGQAIRQEITGASRHCHILRKCPRSCDADTLPVEAVVSLLVAAEVTLPAVEIRVDGYPVPRSELGDSITDLNYNPRKLMSGDKREVAHILIAVNVQVSTADADPCHLYNDFIWLAGRISDPPYG
jgi:hypothetical protein